MNGLLSNARLAFLRPANPRDYAHTVSRIIGAILPVTIASTLFRHRSYMRFPLRLSHHQSVTYTVFTGSVSYGSFQQVNACNAVRPASMHSISLCYVAQPGRRPPPPPGHAKGGWMKANKGREWREIAPVHSHCNTFVWLFNVYFQSNRPKFRATALINCA